MSLSEEAEVTPERDRFPQSWFLDINGGGGGDTRPRVSGRRASFPAAKLAGVCFSNPSVLDMCAPKRSVHSHLSGAGSVMFDRVNGGTQVSRSLLPPCESFLVSSAFKNPVKRSVGRVVA